MLVWKKFRTIKDFRNALESWTINCAEKNILDNDTEKQCVKSFEKSCGNSSTIILKKLLLKVNFVVKELEDQHKVKLIKLINDATKEIGVTTNFLKGIK